MKVSLIVSRNDKEIVFSDPTILNHHLGIRYLASELRRYGQDVMIIDAESERCSNESIVKRIIQYNPEVVGLSPVCTNINISLKIAEEIKKNLDHVHIVFGGQHTSFIDEELLLKYNFIDSVVRGEGEITLRELVFSLGNGKNLREVQGVTWRGGSTIVKNHNRPVIKDLDSLAFPARDGTEEFIKKVNKPHANVCTSRGCVEKCSICTTPNFYSREIGSGPKWRTRSVKNIADEIEYLVDNFQISSLYFSDDNFLGTGHNGKERMWELVKEFRNRDFKITFSFMCRAKSFTEKDKNLLFALKGVGLRRMFIGLEAGSQPSLDIFCKRKTVADNINIAMLLESYNIAMNIGFIMFHPYVTMNDLKENARFLKKISQAATTETFCSRFLLFPGIDLNARLEKDNLIKKSSTYNFLGYRFLDPRIELLADRMSSLTYQTLEFDRFVRNYKVRFFEASDILNHAKTLLTCDKFEKGIDLQKTCTEIYKDINSENASFFLAAIAMAKEDQLERNFNLLSEKHVDRLSEMFDKLKFAISNFEEFSFHLI